MIIRTIFVAAFVCVGSLGAAQAQSASDVWECTLKDGKEGNWVPKTIIIGFQDDRKKAVIADSVILHFMGKPVAAKVQGKGKTLSLFWDVTNAKDAWDRSLPRMQYVGYFTKDSKKFAVKAKVAGSSQFFSGRGKCAPIKNMALWKKIMKAKSR